MKFRRNILSILIVALLLIGVPQTSLRAQSGPVSYPPETVTSLQAIMDDYTAKETPPGLVVWVDGPDQQFAGASGYSDLSTQTPMPPDGLFRIGSVSKVFTSTLILQLVEEGAVSLSDTLVQWLPELGAQITNGDTITIRQMLSHTSGIYDLTSGSYMDDLIASAEVEGDVAQVACGLTPTEAITHYVAGHDAVFAPGERYEYSNTNFELLGLIVEAATGKTFETVLRERILDPLHMTHTYMDCTEDPIDGLVHSYDTFDIRYDVTGVHESVAWAAGGIVSNAPDLILFARALFAGELFQDSAMLKMMTVPVKGLYGLGMMIDTAGYGHYGGITGFAAMMFYRDDLDTVFIVLGNSMQAAPLATIGRRVETVVADQ